VPVIDPNNPYTLDPYVDGIIGSVVSVLQNQNNSGTGGSVLNPQGQEPQTGSASGMDGQGAGVTGGQDPGPCGSSSGIGGSGQGMSGSCMSDDQQNANPCALNCVAGPQCLGLPPTQCPPCPCSGVANLSNTTIGTSGIAGTNTATNQSLNDTPIPMSGPDMEETASTCAQAGT
jgi:hypothetical protein